MISAALSSHLSATQTEQLRRITTFILKFISRLSCGLYPWILLYYVAISKSEESDDMKRICSFLISILLLISYRGIGSAEYYEKNGRDAVFTPKTLTETLNENITSAVNLLYSGYDEKRKQELIAYLQIKLSETEKSFLYFDNEDWMIELTAYYENGRANIYSCADTITFSFPAGEVYSNLYRTLGTAFISAVYDLDNTLDYNQLVEYLNRCYNDYLKTGLDIREKAFEPLRWNGFECGVMLYKQAGMERFAIALLQDISESGTTDEKAVMGKEYTGSLTGYTKVYFRDAVATSELQEGDICFIADNAINLNLYRPWVEGVKGDGIGQSITMKFEKTETVNILGFQIGYASTQDLYDINNRPRTVRISFSDGSEFDYTFRDTREEQYIQLNRPIKSDFIKVEILDVYPGTECSDTCLYMVRAFQ